MPLSKEGKNIYTKGYADQFSLLKNEFKNNGYRVKKISNVYSVLESIKQCIKDLRKRESHIYEYLIEIAYSTCQTDYTPSELTLENKPNSDNKWPWEHLDDFHKHMMEGIDFNKMEEDSGVKELARSFRIIRSFRPIQIEMASYWLEKVQKYFAAYINRENQGLRTSIYIDNYERSDQYFEKIIKIKNELAILFSKKRATKDILKLVNLGKKLEPDQRFEHEFENTSLKTFLLTTLRDNRINKELLKEVGQLWESIFEQEPERYFGKENSTYSGINLYQAYPEVERAAFELERHGLGDTPSAIGTFKSYLKHYDKILHIKKEHPDLIKLIPDYIQ